MNYYRPPPVQLAVLDLQRVPAVPAVLSPIPVVTALMSKSAQAAHVEVPMPPGKPEPPDLVVMQSHSGTDYHQPMSQLSDISGSAYPKYPLSHHRCPGCPAPELQPAQSP
ncbi:hypothetical protein Tco_1174371 [Tanacetum coccineum]